MVSGVQGVLKLIILEMLNINPFWWRDEGFSTPFTNSGTKYVLGK